MSRDEATGTIRARTLPGAIPVTRNDAVIEGERLVAAARAAGIDIYLMGGIAIRLACQPYTSVRELRRSYQDIDFAIRSRSTGEVTRFLIGEGYQPSRRFNAVNGESRLLFNDFENDRHIDVFVGSFQMCHKLALEPRLALAEITLPASDLLLLKLQIVQLNHKDVQDILAILLRFEPKDITSAAGLDLRYIAGVCASDWGWYRTLSDNLVRVRELAGRILSDDDQLAQVQRKVGQILAAVEEAPKSISWRMRNRIGRRVAWYDLPEEVPTSPDNRSE